MDFSVGEVLLLDTMFSIKLTELTREIDLRLFGEQSSVEPRSIIKPAILGLTEHIGTVAY